jgi:hypothetical protein
MDRKNGLGTTSRKGGDPDALEETVYLVYRRDLQSISLEGRPASALQWLEAGLRGPL